MFANLILVPENCPSLKKKSIKWYICCGCCISIHWQCLPLWWTPGACDRQSSPRCRGCYDDAQTGSDPTSEHIPATGEKPQQLYNGCFPPHHSWQWWAALLFHVRGSYLQRGQHVPASHSDALCWAALLRRTLVVLRWQRAAVPTLTPSHPNNGTCHIPYTFKCRLSVARCWHRSRLVLWGWAEPHRNGSGPALCQRTACHLGAPVFLYLRTEIYPERTAA